LGEAELGGGLLSAGGDSAAGVGSDPAPSPGNRAPVPLPPRFFDLFPNAPNKPARTRPARNAHPTLKPIELMRWLVRLVSPPGGLVLDPFCGSGSTGAAAALEGRRFLGIELSPEHVEIASARITHWAPGEGKVDRGPFGGRP
jgi:DNA modification methylase